MATWPRLGNKATINSSREDYKIKKLATALFVLASPAIAQSNAQDAVRFTGFLGNLQFDAADVRADLVGAGEDMRQIAIVMDEEAAAAFAMFTRTHLNQSIVMYVCGQTVVTTTVTVPIETGYAISGPVALDLATDMVDALNGLRDCPE